MRKLAGAAAGAVALAAIAVLNVPSTAAPAGARFGAPVKVTPDLGYGYEPTVVADRYGNLFATAHKENWQLAVGPDGRATAQNRSMSWAWWSRDNGKTWQNLPTGPGDAYSHNFGDEGDMASDDAGYTYFADMNVHDVTFTAWKASGKGEVALEHHLPLAAFAEPMDDRPWITAHGDGHVYYFGNMGNKSWYPGGRQPVAGDGSDANGPGRYTVYQSHDHGRTWDHLGFTLKDSGWCRPAADHTRNSPYVYAFCGNDNDTIYSFVSADRGKTWKRYTVDEYIPAKLHDNAGADSYPTIQVAKDGSIWAMHVSGNEDDRTQVIKLYHSKNHGKTWTKQTITPKKGWYVYTWLGVSPDGKKLGMGAYFRASEKQPWKVYGAVWTPGAKPVLTSLDDKHPVAPASEPSPPGDYLTANFSPDGTLNIVWTRIVGSLPVSDPTDTAPHNIQRDIYFARSL
jgi:hypothetical protein